MSGHRIDWTFEGFAVSPTVVCEEEPGADCRLTSQGCPCESYVIERDPDGTPFHMVDGERHELVPQEECNVVLFLEEDTAECAEPGQGFLLASHPIEPLWQGDYYEWRRL